MELIIKGAVVRKDIFQVDCILYYVFVKFRVTLYMYYMYILRKTSNFLYILLLSLENSKCHINRSETKFQNKWINIFNKSRSCRELLHVVSPPPPSFWLKQQYRGEGGGVANIFLCIGLVFSGTGFLIFLRANILMKKVNS